MKHIGCCFLVPMACVSESLSVSVSLSLCFSLLLWYVCVPSVSHPSSPFIILVPPVPCCPFSLVGLHWHGHPSSLFSPPLQLHQKRVATAAGDPLVEDLDGHWPWEFSVGRRNAQLGFGYPAGVPRSWQPSLAVNSAKIKALVFTHRLPGPHHCPALGTWGSGTCPQGPGHP